MVMKQRGKIRSGAIEGDAELTVAGTALRSPALRRRSLFLIGTHYRDKHQAQCRGGGPQARHG